VTAARSSYACRLAVAEMRLGNWQQWERFGRPVAVAARERISAKLDSILARGRHYSQRESI